MTPRQQALEELGNFFSGIVESFDQRFDTHAFILRLAHRHQHPYIRALTAYQDTDHPFMSLHGEIGKRLFARKDLVRKVGTQNSRDIFGQENSAAIWEKRSR